MHRGNTEATQIILNRKRAQRKYTEHREKKRREKENNEGKTNFFSRNEKSVANIPAQRVAVTAAQRNVWTSSTWHRWFGCTKPWRIYVANFPSGCVTLIFPSHIVVSGQQRCDHGIALEVQNSLRFYRRQQAVAKRDKPKQNRETQREREKKIHRMNWKPIQQMRLNFHIVPDNVDIRFAHLASNSLPIFSHRQLTRKRHTKPAKTVENNIEAFELAGRRFICVFSLSKYSGGC